LRCQVAERLARLIEGAIHFSDNASVAIFQESAASVLECGLVIGSRRRIEHAVLQDATDDPGRIGGAPLGFGRRVGKRREELGQLEGKWAKHSGVSFWPDYNVTDDRAKVEWVVRGRKGDRVELSARHERAGTVRTAVKGASPGPATPDELARMADLVRASLDEGAIGLSTGLGYAPGIFADTDELVAVTRPLGERCGERFSILEEDVDPDPRVRAGDSRHVAERAAGRVLDQPLFISVSAGERAFCMSK